MHPTIFSMRVSLVFKYVEELSWMEIVLFKIIVMYYLLLMNLFSTFEIYCSSNFVNHIIFAK